METTFQDCSYYLTNSPHSCTVSCVLHLQGAITFTNRRRHPSPAPALLAIDPPPPDDIAPSPSKGPSGAKKSDRKSPLRRGSHAPEPRILLGDRRPPHPLCRRHRPFRPAA